MKIYIYDLSIMVLEIRDTKINYLYNTTTVRVFKFKVKMSLS
jgi:hypothetical protein